MSRPSCSRLGCCLGRKLGRKLGCRLGCRLSRVLGSPLGRRVGGRHGSRLGKRIGCRLESGLGWEADSVADLKTGSTAALEADLAVDLNSTCMLRFKLQLFRSLFCHCTVDIRPRSGIFSQSTPSEQIYRLTAKAHHPELDVCNGVAESPSVPTATRQLCIGKPK